VIVLDTHVWLWHVGARERLSSVATAAIENAGTVAVCAISCWEVSMLEARGRIALDRPVRRWVARALAGTALLPLSASAAVDAGQLGGQGFHGDPADRLIYATARELGLRIVTRDERLTAFDRARCVW
jgi:PIN domain nuclease of toxin-antitoxin system